MSVRDDKEEPSARPPATSATSMVRRGRGKFKMALTSDAVEAAQARKHNNANTTSASQSPTMGSPEQSEATESEAPSEHSTLREQLFKRLRLQHNFLWVSGRSNATRNVVPVVVLMPYAGPMPDALRKRQATRALCLVGHRPEGSVVAAATPPLAGEVAPTPPRRGLEAASGASSEPPGGGEAPHAGIVRYVTMHDAFLRVCDDVTAVLALEDVRGALMVGVTASLGFPIVGVRSSQLFESHPAEAFFSSLPQDSGIYFVKDVAYPIAQFAMRNAAGGEASDGAGRWDAAPREFQRRAEVTVQLLDENRYVVVKLEEDRGGRHEPVQGSGSGLPAAATASSSQLRMKVVDVRNVGVKLSWSLLALPEEETAPATVRRPKEMVGLGMITELTAQAQLHVDNDAALLAQAVIEELATELWQSISGREFRNVASPLILEAGTLSAIVDAVDKGHDVFHAQRATSEAPSVDARRPAQRLAAHVERIELSRRVWSSVLEPPGDPTPLRPADAVYMDISHVLTINDIPLMSALASSRGDAPKLAATPTMGGVATRRGLPSAHRRRQVDFRQHDVFDAARSNPAGVLGTIFSHVAGLLHGMQGTLTRRPHHETAARLATKHHAAGDRGAPNDGLPEVAAAKGHVDPDAFAAS